MPRFGSSNNSNHIPGSNSNLSLSSLASANHVNIKRNHFVLYIPQSEPLTHRAVRSFIKGTTSPVPPSTSSLNNSTNSCNPNHHNSSHTNHTQTTTRTTHARIKWDQTALRAQELKHAVKEAQLRVKELQTKRQTTLAHIRETHGQELEASLAKIEKKMRIPHEKKQLKQQEEDMERMKKEGERRLLQARDDHKKKKLEQHKRDDEKEDNETEIESDTQHPPTKRIKLANDEKEGDNENKNHSDVKGDNASSLAGKTSEVEVSLKPTVTIAEGEDSAKQQVEESASTESEQLMKDSKPAQNLESDTKQKEVKEFEQHVDQLKEKKSQMVWLLRQVITAEKKRKEQMKK